MPLTLPVVWSDDCLLHEPGGETWLGLPLPGDELPERVTRIRDTLAGAGARIVEAEAHGDEELLAVHDAALVEFLRTAWGRWSDEGYPSRHGRPRVVPYIFPHPAFADREPRLLPASAAALTGAFAFDTMTPIGPGTWRAARAALDVALTACDLVLDGAPVAYACLRPPGHHATRGAYGGSCYLNNTAAAAERLRRRGRRVAVVDVDAHHGNGAQSIFWDDEDVLTVSVHVDPADGWFPHFLGTAAESRPGNLNLPLPSGSGDDPWCSAVERAVAAVRAHGADALVVALGLDPAAVDPESPLEVTAAGFRRAGALLGGLGLETVVVQEGGYDLAALGGLALAALEGIEEELHG